jgi:hypothetical protein
LEMPECVDWDVQVEEISGLEPLLEMSSSIAVATFGMYGEPRWNTPGGERPSWDQYTNAEYPVTIIRNVELDVEEFLRGTDAELAGAYARGGQIGCDSVTYTNMPEFTAGDRAIFFFAPLVIQELSPDPLPQLARVWAIEEDGTLRAYSGGGSGLTLDELQAKINEVPFAPWPSQVNASPSPQ